MTDRKLYLGPLTDNRRWDAVPLRTDDVIVVTPPKCGTTWMQTIVALLLSGDPDIEPDLTVKMPWIDIRLREIAEVVARLDAMTERRCFKSHTPMDGLPLRNDVQYLCVLRHPLDAHMSYRRHLANIPITFFDFWYPADDVDGVTFRRFLDGGAEGFDGDAMPLAYIIQHFVAARALADHPNVSLFHYADMSRDLRGTFDRVAKALGISHPAHVMEALVQVATFAHMQSDPARYAPGGGSGFYKSDAAFFHSGASGQWVEHLTQSEIDAYDAAMEAQLSPKDRAWLEFGAAGV